MKAKFKSMKQGQILRASQILPWWAVMTCGPPNSEYLIPIDLFKLSLSDNIPSVQIEIYHKLCAAPYPLRGSNNHKLQQTSLKSLQILSCDPMCQIRKISSLFGTLGHKQSIITPPVNRSSEIFPVDVSRWYVSVTSARCVSLIGFFGHFKSKLYFFCWILSRFPA